MENYVTEWGLPGLRWYDIASRMTGNPFTENMPKVANHLVERRLWISYDVSHVCALEAGHPVVVGLWKDFQVLELGTTRDDLSPQDFINLERRRLRWIEHHTLTAHFSDGSSARIAQSTGPKTKMMQLHQAIERAFLTIRPRGDFVPPQGGRALPGETVVPPIFCDLEPGEESESRWNIKESDRRIEWRADPHAPCIAWHEPVSSRKFGPFGTSYHLVQRLIYIGRGSGDGRRWLSFNTYRRDGRVQCVNVDFNLFHSFGLGSNLGSIPNAHHPVPGVQKGAIIWVLLRYGYKFPITCTPDAERAKLLRSALDAKFLPLVGRTLSDKDLGFASLTPLDQPSVPASANASMVRNIPIKESGNLDSDSLPSHF